MARNTAPTVSYPADMVWAAASAAQRINGAYIKAGQGYDAATDTVKPSNRELMLQLLDQRSNEITEQDREHGVLVRKGSQALMFDILKGKILNDFQQTALAISNRDEITSGYDIAVMASLPSGFERTQARNTVEQRVRFAQGGLVGQVGDKVTARVEVLRSSFSQQWMTWFITAVTEQDQPVFFSFKSELAVGSTVAITGTVKAHRDGQTQFNRVKLVRN
jgi:hypothetical protein